ncbi:Os04g0342400 [Oryza sativa Japonica Group]|uniref:Os04g0342400 protein n=1 Tax=Oryza sativa subsp. japonica TaxID=39947 RepID=A0A0N7KIV5_ORYSJ|nr:Os04g0342400 [Oryza sativa Japonica Group]
MEDDDAPASVFGSGADGDEHRGLKVALQCRGRRSGRQGGWGKAGAAAIKAVGVEEPEQRRAKEEVGRRFLLGSAETAAMREMEAAWRCGRPASGSEADVDASD